MTSFFTKKNIIIGISALLLAFILYYFRNIVAFILIAAVLSLILQPIVAALTSLRIGSIRIPKGIAAGAAILFFWSVIFLFVRLLIPLIAHEAATLSNIQINYILNEFQDQFSHFINRLEYIDLPVDDSTSFAQAIFIQLLEFFNLNDFSNLVNNLTNTISTIAVGFFIVTFAAFFFLKDEKLFFSSVLLLVPSEYEMEVKHILLSSKRLLVRYFIGILFDMILIFSLITIGMSIIGIDIKHATTMGLVGACLNIIPYVGPILSLFFGLTLGMLIHFEQPIFDGLTPMLIWMGIVYITINIMDSTLIQPFIFSKSVKAHPLEIFLVIVMAGTVAGIPGMILAIPSYTVIRVVAKEFLSRFKLVRKLTEKM